MTTLGVSTGLQGHHGTRTSGVTGLLGQDQGVNSRATGGVESGRRSFYSGLEFKTRFPCIT